MTPCLMMEQPHAGNGHNHIVFVAGLNDGVVPDGAPRLCHIGNPGKPAPFDGVAEGEEGVGA